MKRWLWVGPAVLAALLLVAVAAAGCKPPQESAPATPTGPQQSTAPATPAAATAAVYTCPMHPEVTSDEPGKCPKCGMNLVLKQAAGKASDEGAAASKPAPSADKSSADKPAAQEAAAAQTYYCPMHPEVTSDKPGRCPECGMYLEPKKEAATQDPPAPAAKAETAKAKAEQAPAAAQYACPMGDYTSDKPGDCPKCGMKLELKDT